MKVNLHKQFKKNYQKRIASNKNLAKKTQQRVRLFIKDPKSPLLKDHALTGKKEHLRAFSITGDIRIIYLIDNQKHCLFYDIGTHNQVY